MTSSFYRLPALFVLVAWDGLGLHEPSGFAAETAARPNIVLLITDDQRWDALGAMGNKVIQTPHLDALARDGVLFTNCFCTTSICCTSRASILSGQYARRHKIWGFRTPFSREAFAETFPALLRDAGYRTGFVGKWGLGGQMPADQYDYWGGYAGQGRYYEKDRPKQGEHLTRKLTSQSLEFLAGCTKESPFCLHVSFKAPHCQDGDPWQFPYDYQLEKLYQDHRIEPPSTATEQHFHRLPSFLQSSEARRRWGLRFDGEEMFQNSVKDYYRLISGVDVAVGRIVQALRDQGLADNTIIIFSSDNGYYLGDYGLAGKWFMHDPSIRLPLLIYDPRHPADGRRAMADEMVLNIDLAPTILAAAGLQAPQSMQGANLLPLAREGISRLWRDRFLYEHLFKHDRIPMTEGVRTLRWKYVRYSSEQPVFEELFDLVSDPKEENNLAAVPAQQERLAKLRAAWRRLANQAEAK